MSVLDLQNLSYATWKERAQTFSLPTYHVFAGAAGTLVSHEYILVYAGNFDVVFATKVYPVDETDWSTEFPSSVEYANTEDAVAAIYGSLGLIVPFMISDGNTIATVRELGLSDALNVALVDGYGDHITSLAGTEYTEDDPAALFPTGIITIAVRADTLSAVTDTDGDNIATRATNKGELYVKHVDAIPVTDNGGSLTIDNSTLSVVGGGTEATALRVTLANDSTGVISVQDDSSLVDNTGFTDGTSKVLPAGYILDETAGTALTENDVAAARIDSKRAQVFVIEDGTTRGQRASVATTGAVKTREHEDGSFMVVSTGTATANNKSMLSIFNVDTTRKVRVHAIWLVNVQTSSVTGVITSFELRRLTGTAPSGGTDLTTTGVEQLDTTDIKDSDWTVMTGATVGTESTKFLWRTRWSSDEWGTGTLDQEGFDHGVQTMLPMWGKHNGTTKPIVLRENEGITVKCATNTTTGSFDIFAIVSEEG